MPWEKDKPREIQCTTTKPNPPSPWSKTTPSAMEWQKEGHSHVDWGGGEVPYVKVQGGEGNLLHVDSHGSGHVVLYGPNGEPVSSTNRIPVDADIQLPYDAENPMEVRARALETLLQALGQVDFATQDTLADVLAKLSDNPATAANQIALKAVLDAIEGKDFATQTTLEDVLSKLSSDPATAANQIALKSVLEALATKDFATQATVAAILSKLSDDPATSAGQSAVEQAVAALAQLAATETTLAQVNSRLETLENLLTNGDQKTQLTGTPEVTLTGTVVAEQLTDANATNGVLTFSDTIQVVEIWHGEAGLREFVVNGLTLQVGPGGWRSPVGGTPSTDVAIPAGIPCAVARLV